MMVLRSLALAALLLCPPPALAAFSMFQAAGGGAVIPPPPVVSSVVATPSPTTAAVTWTTSTPSNSVVNYATAANYAIHGYDTLQSDPTLVTSHSINLASLTATTTYHFDVCSTDAYAQPTCSPDSTFTTTGGASIPTIVAGSAQPGNTTTAGDASHPSWSTAPAISQSLLAQQGAAGQGFIDNVVAVWDYPQYSLISGATNNVCVIGYHQGTSSLSAPLAKVAFFLDNGTELDISSSNFTHFGAAEFCVNVSDVALADGPHELRAIAYPFRGYPRPLASVQLATTTASSAKLAVQAHGVHNQKIMRVSGSTDATLVNGIYCVNNDANLDPSHFSLAPYTGAYPVGQSGGAGTCGATSTSATTGGSTITVSKERAGLNEAQADAGGSLWFVTNHNGTLLPATHTTVYADSVSGNNANTGFAPASAKADIQHAVAAIVPANDGATWTSNGTTTLANAANAYSLNQAVTVSGTLPSPLVAGRPYWIVNTVPNASVQLGLEPCNGACGGSAITVANGGSFTINADFSYFNLDLECSGACASPSTYGVFSSIPGFTLPQSYGWLNVAPYSTAHTNTVINDGIINGGNNGLATKVHWQVDLTDSLVHGADWNIYHWGSGQLDTWLDSMTYTGVCGSCGINIAGGSIFGVAQGPYYGYVQLTYATTQNISDVSMSNNVITTVVGGTTNQSASGGQQDGVRSLVLGHTIINDGGNTAVAPQLVSEDGTHKILTFANGALPANLTTASLGNWAVVQDTGTGTTYPTSGCLSSGGGSIASVTHSPDVVTLNTATGSLCAVNDFIPIETNTHSHINANFDPQQYGNYYVGSLNNQVFAYNACNSNSCFGNGWITRQTSSPFNARAANMDVAVIGNATYPFASPATCSSGNYRTCLWGNNSATITLQESHINTFWFGNTFANGTMGSGNPGASYFENLWGPTNSCAGTAAGQAAANFNGGGFTFQPGGGC